MGVGLPAINPTAVALDLNAVNFDDITNDLLVSQEKMDEVEDAIRRSLTILANKS